MCKQLRGMTQIPEIFGTVKAWSYYINNYFRHQTNTHTNRQTQTPCEQYSIFM